MPKVCFTVKIIFVKTKQQKLFKDKGLIPVNIEKIEFYER